MNEAEERPDCLTRRIEADSDGLVYFEPHDKESDAHPFAVNQRHDERARLGPELVRRWNAHAGLVDTLRQALAAAEGTRRYIAEKQASGHVEEHWLACVDASAQSMVRGVRAALAAAGVTP